MQATVETDTEESLGTNANHDGANKTQTAPRKGENASIPARTPKEEPPPSLEKREGGYSHAPPLRFARDIVVTSSLHIHRPKQPASTIRQRPERSKKKSIAVWSGDEVHIVDVDTHGPHKAAPPRVRPHRRTL